MFSEENKALLCKRAWAARDYIMLGEVEFCAWKKCRCELKLKESDSETFLALSMLRKA